VTLKLTSEKKINSTRHLTRVIKREKQLKLTSVLSLINLSHQAYIPYVLLINIISDISNGINKVFWKECVF